MFLMDPDLLYQYIMFHESIFGKRGSENEIF